MEFTNYRTDNSKSETGVWMSYDGAEFLIARFGNPTFTNYLEQLKRPYERQIANGTFPNSKLINIGAKALAKYILLDWKGLTENGEPLQYSEQKAYELLSDPYAEEFRELISKLSQDVEQFREDRIAETEKKSATS